MSFQMRGPELFNRLIKTYFESRLRLSTEHEIQHKSKTRTVRLEQHLPKS